LAGTTDYYSMGCDNDDDVVGATDPLAQATARVRKDMQKTSDIMAEVNGKIAGSSVRQPFKDIWSDFYSRWLDYTKGNPVLKPNGHPITNSALGTIEDAVLDYRRRALLMYDAWKKETKRDTDTRTDGQGRTELFDSKNVDKWKAAKWGLGLLALVGTVWGTRKLLMNWQDERREKQKGEREDKRLERLERLGLIEPMSNGGGGQPNQVASPTVTPVTIVMPQGAMFAGPPQVSVSTPYQPPQHQQPPQRQLGPESARDIATRVMRSLPPTPPPLFPHGRKDEPAEPGDFEELPDGFGHPEPQGY
jgi:hypothetical protein